MPELRISAQALPLPEGVKSAKYVQDMREIVVYEISTDKFRVRWDTIIDGIQYTVSKWQSENSDVTAEFFASTERASTRQLMVDLALTGIELEAKVVRKP